jgi:hypothetical protein
MTKTQIVTTETLFHYWLTEILMNWRLTQLYKENHMKKMKQIHFSKQMAGYSTINIVR